MPQFGGPPIWLDIAGTEIEAVCRLMRVPARDRGEVLMLVRAMARAAGPVLNESK